MILKNIKIFSQNICKNNFIINTILEMQYVFDIIFIQELFWSFIYSILSSKNSESEELVGVPNHSNWTTFFRNLSQGNSFSKVITYINIQLFPFCFSLWKDIFNHRDISCVSFFNCGSVYFLINIYSNSSQTALKYLKDTKANISNILIMTRDFNIRDSSRDLYFLYYSFHKDTLVEVTDFFHLDLFRPTEQVSTRYSDKYQDFNSVIDLMFLRLESLEQDNYTIYSE